MDELERLKDLCCKMIDELIAEHATASLPEFETCHKRLEQLISKKYGKESVQYKNFIKRTFRPDFPNASTQDFVEACKRDLIATKEDL